MKYVAVKLLKDKKCKIVLNAFNEIVNESNLKPNKLWVYQGREFYDKFMQEWLDNKNILMHSTHGEGKSVILEMFIKHYRLKSIRKMITNNNKSYLAYLNKLVDQYNNTCHHSINKIAIGFA